MRAVCSTRMHACDLGSNSSSIIILNPSLTLSCFSYLTIKSYRAIYTTGVRLFTVVELHVTNAKRYTFAW